MPNIDKKTEYLKNLGHLIPYSIKTLFRSLFPIYENSKKPQFLPLFLSLIFPYSA